jgi:hypothetical protein
VILTGAQLDADHPALGREFLGGADDLLSQDPESDPPRPGQLLVFLLPGGTSQMSGKKKTRRIYSDAPLVTAIGSASSRPPPSSKRSRLLTAL